MEELQIPERLEAIEERGYILEITPHNQPHHLHRNHLQRVNRA